MFIVQVLILVTSGSWYAVAVHEKGREQLQPVQQMRRDVFSGYGCSNPLARELGAI